VTLPIASSQYEGYQTLETKYFILKATPEKLAMVNPQVIDAMYEFYLSITGVPPLGENKILVIWDLQLDTSVTDTAHKIIHIGKNRWDNKDDFYDELAYELTHIFIYSQKNMRIISPSVGEFHGIGGGWYLFLYTELGKNIGMFSPEEYEKLIKYCEKRLTQYEKAGAKLEELRPYYNGYVFEGMLMTYVEKYGIEALKRFFILVTSLEIPDSVDSWSAFVWAMGIAAGDLNGVYSLFRDKWHFPVKYGFFIVNVSVIGFRGNYTLKIDKESIKLDKENLSLLLPNDTAHLISISPQIVTLSDKERVICKNYSFGVQNNTAITFTYIKQYYLDLKGWWGNWYDADSEAKATVPRLIEFNNETRKTFAGFFDEKGNLISKENSTTIKMDSPKTLQVKWEKEYRLQVKSEYGEVNGSGWYKVGKEVTVSVTKAIIDYGNSTRRKFSGWYESNKLMGKEPTLIILVNEPKTITANWETEYEIRVIVKEETLTNWYKKGEKVTVSVPSTEIYESWFIWRFRGWEIEGKIVSNSPQYSFEVKGPLTVRAIWEKELNTSLVTIIILAAILLLSAIVVLPKKMHLK
jgi:hypothetical protein